MVLVEVLVVPLVGFSINNRGFYFRIKLCQEQKTLLQTLVAK